MKWQDKEVLHLVLMRDPFERIMNGTKPVEYRDNTPYWYKRLNDKDIKYIYFQYAYHKNPTHMVVECTTVKVFFEYYKSKSPILLQKIIAIIMPADSQKKNMFG